MSRDRVIGWRIDREDREELLGRFAPRYPRVIADHVTFGRAEVAPEMPTHSHARVVGRADDGQGVEALVVALGGSTDRWDGSTYHITWSLSEGRQAKESNAVIARHGWTAIADGPDVRLEADEWP
jgi:hypothetical protein